MVRDGPVRAARRRGAEERRRRVDVAAGDGELERRAAPGRVRVVARAVRERDLRATRAPEAAREQERRVARLVEGRVRFDLPRRQQARDLVAAALGDRPL